MAATGKDQTGRSPVFPGVYVPRKEVYSIQLGKNDAIKNLVHGWGCREGKAHWFSSFHLHMWRRLKFVLLWETASRMTMQSFVLCYKRASLQEKPTRKTDHAIA